MTSFLTVLTYLTSVWMLTLTLLASQRPGLVDADAATETKGELFSKKNNIRVDQAEEISLCTPPSPDGDGDGSGNGTASACPGGRTSCVLKCNAHARCTGVNFRASDGQCMGVERSLNDMNTPVNDSSGWEHFSPVAKEVRDGDWTLVFRAQRGIATGEGGMLSVWDDDATQSDENLGGVHRDCYSVRELGCPDYFRSKLLTTWPSSQIHQVRLALYTGGELKAEMVFNGEGSTRYDWFSPSRLNSSTWTDLLPSDPTAVLAINGNVGNLDRDHRIFVAASSLDAAGCARVGWMVVIDRLNVVCSYDLLYDDVGQTSYPGFLYSDTNQKIDFDGSYSQAEVMTVFVKLQ